METKKIQCPSCGVLLEVRNSKNEAVKIIECPQCGTQLRVRFPQKDDSVMDARTFIAGMDIGGETIVPGVSPKTAAKAIIVCEGNTYELHEGRNIVGRKASTSTADVQLLVADRYMSRLNAIVCVRKAGDKLLVTIANYKNVNPVKVGAVTLLDGDEVLLEDGDEIIMGTTKMRLKIE